MAVATGSGIIPDSTAGVGSTDSTILTGRIETSATIVGVAGDRDFAVDDE
jgi:hypothetical protein